MNVLIKFFYMLYKLRIKSIQDFELDFYKTINNCNRYKFIFPKEITKLICKYVTKLDDIINLRLSSINFYDIIDTIIIIDILFTNNKIFHDEVHDYPSNNRRKQNYEIYHNFVLNTKTHLMYLNTKIKYLPRKINILDFFI